MTDEPTRFHERPPSVTLQAFFNADDLIGRVLKGAYRIDGKIGEGGMGVVYKAAQVALGRPVAVKMMHMGQSGTTLVDRFFREAKLLSQLQHPNIVQIIDFGTEGSNLHFMVMEFLTGETLESFLKTKQRVQPRYALDLLEQIGAGITAAHQSGIIHRDLKPANIFIINVTGSVSPLVKLLDFGLGKAMSMETQSTGGLTREGMMLGTLGYSAPEQIQGLAVDHRADVYSLGAILYFLLTGRSPFRDDFEKSTLVKQLTGTPDPIGELDLGAVEAASVEAVLRKALSVNPAQRYATVTELIAEVRSVIRPNDTVPDSTSKRSVVGVMPAQQPQTPAKRSRRELLVAGTIVAATLGGAGLWWWNNRPKARLNPGATAPGVTGEEIIIGMSSAFSGSAERLGRGMKLGIETCFKEINAKGGIFGRQLRLKTLDDGYEPKQTVKNVEEMFAQSGDSEGVFALMGNVGTPTTEAILPLAAKEKRIVFGAFTGARSLRKTPPDWNVFNFRAGYAEETAVIVKYLREHKKIQPDQIAVFAQKDSFGDAGFAGVARALRAEKVDPVRVGYERNSIDVSAAIKGIIAMKDKIKAVVMVSTTRQAARFIAGIEDAAPEMIFTNVSFVGQDLGEELRDKGAKYAEGVIVTQVVPHFASQSRGVMDYREQLKRFFPEERPGFVSLEGYIAARIFCEGLQKAGPNLTSETLRDGLESIQGLDLAIGTKISFSPSEHTGSQKVWGTILNAEGEYQELELD
jgi:serine/threonine protein kinase